MRASGRPLFAALVPHALKRFMPISHRSTHDSVAPVVRVDHRVDHPCALSRREPVGVGEQPQRSSGRPATLRDVLARSGAHRRAAQATSRSPSQGWRGRSRSARRASPVEDDVVEVRVIVADRAGAKRRPGPAARRAARDRTATRVVEARKSPATRPASRRQGPRPVGLEHRLARDEAQRLAAPPRRGRAARHPLEPGPLEVLEHAPVRRRSPATRRRSGERAPRAGVRVAPDAGLRGVLHERRTGAASSAEPAPSWRETSPADRRAAEETSSGPASTGRRASSAPTWRGRETLSFIAGDAVLEPYPPWALTDAALVSVA